MPFYLRRMATESIAHITICSFISKNWLHLIGGQFYIFIAGKSIIPLASSSSVRSFFRSPISSLSFQSFACFDFSILYLYDLIALLMQCSCFSFFIGSIFAFAFGRLFWTKAPQQFSCVRFSQSKHVPQRMVSVIRMMQFTVINATIRWTKNRI